MSTPEERTARRIELERASRSRDQLIGKARHLLNQAKLAGIKNPVYVMHPDTLSFMRPGEHIPPGEAVELDRVPVMFSEELELEQIILAYKGWPYFGEDDRRRF